jgi:hypothetical protein
MSSKHGRIKNVHVWLEEEHVQVMCCCIWKVIKLMFIFKYVLFLVYSQ